MGAGIHHGIFHIVLRQMHVIIPTAKAEAQHPHTRIAYKLQQSPYPVIDTAQIFRHNADARQLFPESLEQAFPGTDDPLAVAGIRSSIRDGIVIGKADEMVNADHIIHGAHGFHPLHPPAVAGQPEIMPPIQRIAPQLTILGKIVRRNACHTLGDSVVIQLEHLRVRPCVRTVLRHVNGHIAKQHQTQVVAILLQCHPLVEEKHLHEKMILHILCQFILIAKHRFLLVQANVFLRPLCPHGIPEVMLHRRKQCHIFRPGVTASELLHLAPHFLPGLSEAQPKPSFLVGTHLVIVHMRRVFIHIGRQAAIVQQAFPPQLFQ